MSKPAVLVLEDGSIFTGTAFGHPGKAVGSVAAHAAISGFTEIVTDPSYRGRMVCFANPHVGNAGVAPDDIQSGKAWAAAVLAREACATPSNWRSRESFPDFLKRHGIPGMEGFDTRRLARLVAEKGQLGAAMACDGDADADALLKLAREKGRAAALGRPDSVRKAVPWSDPAGGKPEKKAKRMVMVYDLGVKTGFLRALAAHGCGITLLPPGFPARDALREKPHGIVFSAGPGDPAAEGETIEQAALLVGKAPLWGVGIGAGILAIAAGGRTRMAEKGHFGCHGVGRAGSAVADMTSQCHQFMVDPDSLASAGLETTHAHLNDGSVEAFASAEKRLMGCLFHPEGCPGPNDARYFFENFLKALGSRKSGWSLFGA